MLIAIYWHYAVKNDPYIHMSTILVPHFKSQNLAHARMQKMLNQNQSQITTTSEYDATWLSARGNCIARQSANDHSLPNAEIGVDVGAGAGVDAESDHSRKFAFAHKDTPQESQIAQSYKPTVLEHLLAMPLA